ncbi:hypothetical protein CHS0354_015116 [Potamilus streckersoni]|uniref:Uncharacterized protein n=1 Tax=Potamilus streckersoni TaxID=2493646 RepID=A0AAE0SRD0_9BIVA|nr:hypothetical protein CHS0354_015116 [Potamilus streckersoni]
MYQTDANQIALVALSSIDYHIFTCDCSHRFRRGSRSDALARDERFRQQKCEGVKEIGTETIDEHHNLAKILELSWPTPVFSYPEREPADSKAYNVDHILIRDNVNTVPNQRGKRI